MRSTPENQVKRKLVALLDRYGVFHWPAAASPYGVAGAPDRLAVVRGECWGLECKRPGGKPTPLQTRFALRLLEAGGKWFLIDGEDALFALETLFKTYGLGEVTK